LGDVVDSGTVFAGVLALLEASLTTGISGAATAIVVTSEEVYPLCRKYGIRIGKDLAIFSCDETNEKLVPEVTEITNDPKNIAQQCWKMFSALSRKEKVQSCHTELKIRIGHTVPSLKTPR
jgi:DNA-binding LacI/PurR family transcriptional regulator